MRLNTRKNTLAVELDEKASADESVTAVSAILFWPAAFALGGNQAQETEYARLKGEFDAVQQAGIEKNCNLKISTSLRMAKITSEENPASAIEFYGQAENEVETNAYDKNLWARALVEVEGDETKRKAKYIEIRANQLHIESGGSMAIASLYEQSAPNAGGLNFDISGDYVSEISSDARRWYFTTGKQRRMKLTLKQDGDKITATNNKYDLKIVGTLDDKYITFYALPSQIASYEITGKWKIDVDNDRMDGTWEVRHHDASGEWNLRRIE